MTRYRRSLLVMLCLLLAAASSVFAQPLEKSGPVFLRLRVLEPQRRFVVRIGGARAPGLPPRGPRRLEGRE